MRGELYKLLDEAHDRVVESIGMLDDDDERIDELQEIEAMLGNAVFEECTSIVRGVSLMGEWTARFVTHDSRYGEVICTAYHRKNEHRFGYLEMSTEEEKMILDFAVDDDESMVETFMIQMTARATLNEFSWVCNWAA